MKNLRLTAQEKEIIELAVLGETNSHISTKLNIKVEEVKELFQKIYSKLGIQNRVQLCIVYLKNKSGT